MILNLEILMSGQNEQERKTIKVLIKKIGRTTKPNEMSLKGTEIKKFLESHY